jgi:radical SAM protein with 4Fe4S-binding SPASM domain
MNSAIVSMPMKDKESIYYYPDVNILTFDSSGEFLGKGSNDFAAVLFNFFLGIRKLKCLSQIKAYPKVLFVEPWRTCNLTCQYCYAKGGPEYTKKINYGDLTDLINKYDFNRVLIFGGEPLLDKDFIKNLHELKQWNSFFFSTNGILMDEEIRGQILTSKNMNVQVSLEPPEWSRRINNRGEKQFDLLRSKMKLFAGSKLSFRIVIPPDAPYLRLSEFIDRITQEVGSYDFGIGYWPVYGKALPKWFDQWIDESYQILKDCEDPKYTNKLLGDVLTGYFFEMQNEGFRFFNCNAAYGSVALGPDGRLHGCHENAIVESDLDVISSGDKPLEIDKNRMRNLAYSWSNNMTNKVCSVCHAKYFCGGMCFVTAQPAASCIFLRKLLPLILTEMIVYKPSETLKLISKTEKVFEKLYAMREELKQQVTSKKWKQLVSGELPLHEAVELAEKYYGH